MKQQFDNAAPSAASRAASVNAKTKFWHLLLVSILIASLLVNIEIEPAEATVSPFSAETASSTTDPISNAFYPVYNSLVFDMLRATGYNPRAGEFEVLAKTASQQGRTENPAQIVAQSEEQLRQVVEASRKQSLIQPLNSIFEQVASEYNIPADLLKAMAYTGSFWEQRPGYASGLGGYGVMQLVQSGSVDRLGEAAKLLGVNPELLKVDAALNIRAAAALLREYAKQYGSTTANSNSLTTLGFVLERWTGYPPDLAQAYIEKVFNILRTGFSGTNSSGESLTVKAQGTNLVTPTVNTVITKNQTTNASSDAYPGSQPSPYPVPSSSYVAGRTQSVRFITLSFGQDNLEGILRKYTDPSKASGVHYVIARDGSTVYELVKEADSAKSFTSTSGLYNISNTVNIVLEGYYNTAPAPTSAMYAKVQDLLQYLVTKYNLALNCDTVVSLGLVNPDYGLNPMPNWDWSRLISGVSATCNTNLAGRNLGKPAYTVLVARGVNPVNGNFIQSSNDLSMPGTGQGIAFSRVYNSQDTRLGWLGTGWSFNVEIQLANTGARVNILYPDGRSTFFSQLADGSYAPQPGFFDRLVRNANGTFTLTRPDQMQFIFAANGKLTSQKDRNGNAITINYGANDLPTTILDSAGRTFTLAFANGRLQSISDGQRSVKYGYGANANYLTSVTDLKGASFGYSYDAAGFLTRIVDGRTNPVITNEYDAGGRVVKQIYPDATLYTFQYAPAFTRVIDTRGVPTTYYFDERGRITKISDVFGNTQLFTYNNDDRVISYTNPAGQTWTYTYDGRGNRLTHTDPQGRTTKMTYDVRNNLTSLTDAAGQIYTYEYDPNGNLKKYNRPDGTSISAEYDAKGQITSISDPKGNKTNYVYDAQGNVIEVIDALKNSTKYQYNQFGQMSEMTDPIGRKMSYVYDAAGNRTGVKDNLGRVSQVDYDADNNISKMVDREGNAFQFDYNYNRQSTKLVGPLGYKVTNTYNSMSLLESQIGPNGETSQIKYDTLRRVVGRQDATGGWSAFVYDTRGNITKQVSPTGAVTEIEYDSLNRPVCVIDTLSNRSCVTYNNLDQIISSRDNLGNEIRYEYDKMGRLLRSYSPPDAGSITTSSIQGPKIPANDPVENFKYEYDENGNTTAKIDGIGRAIRYKYDAQNRLIEEIDPANNSIKQEYNAAGQLIKKIDKRNFATTYEYDTAGRQIKITDPLGLTTLMEYDKENRVTKEVDKRGFATLSEYDALGRKVKMIDPLKGITLYEYNTSGDVIKEVSPGGRVMTYTYDGNKHKLSETDGLGRTTKYEYDAEGRVTKETDALNRVSQATYDKEGRMLALQDAKGGITSYEYDKNGNVLSIIDPLKQITRMTYDKFNRMTEKIDALGGITTSTYDDAHQLLSTKTPRGGTTLYKYDALSRAIEVTDRTGNITKNTYDPNGNLTAITNPRNFTEYREYDALNRLTKETDRLGGVTLKEYDGLDNLVKVTDPLGRISVAEYDALKQKVKVTDALGNTIRYTYDPDGLVLAETNGRGYTTRKEYDVAGQLTKTISPRGAETFAEYDKVGNLTAKIDALGNRWRTEYDALNKVTAEIDPLGRRTEYALDALSRKVGMKNPRGYVTLYEYNALNKLTKVTDAKSGISRYTFDAESNLTSFTDPRGGVDRWNYDLEGRLTSEANGLGNTWRYTYDPAGNRVTAVDARGITLKYEYDALNRATATKYPDNFAQTREYDAVGNLLKLTDRNGVSVYTYDALNRNTVEVRNGRRVAVTYDAVGNINDLTFPNGWTQKREYNPDNQLDRVVDQRGGVYRFTRDLLGRDTDLVYPNGVKTFKTFNAAGQLTALVNQGANNRLLTRYDYELDANGNRTTIKALYDNQADADPGEDWYNGAGPKALPPRKYAAPQTAYTNGDLKVLNTGYTYDELDRLTTERHSSGLNIDYTLDPNGNITRKEVRHSQRQGRPFNYDQTFAYNAANNLTSMFDAGETVALEYDTNGNRTLKRTGKYESKYSYDEENRLVKVDTIHLPGSGNGGGSNGGGNGNGSDEFRPKKGTTEYGYDGFGRLQNVILDRNGNGQDYDATRLYWGKILVGQEWDGKYKDQDDVYFTLGEGDDVLGSISHERRPRENGSNPNGNPSSNGRGSPHTLRYHQFDGLGSLVVVTNRIAHVVGSQGFSAYGEQFDHKQLDQLPLLGFTGKDYDDATGLTHFQARWYDADIARWMGDDTYQGTLENPLSRNRSLYVHANPINKVDPNGNEPDDSGGTNVKSQLASTSGAPSGEEEYEEIEVEEPNLGDAINGAIDNARTWIDEQVGKLADGVTNVIWGGVKDFKIWVPFGDLRPQRHQIQGMVHGLLDAVKGWLITPILDDIQDATNSIDFSSGQSAFVSLFGEIGKRLGGKIGSELGGRIGEKLGSLAGGAIGGPLGGLIGHFVGGWVGGAVGEALGSELGRMGGEFIGGLIWDNTIQPFMDMIKELEAGLVETDAPTGDGEFDLMSNGQSPSGIADSFAPATLVVTAEGERRIDSIKVGDKVLAYNQDTGENGYYTVTDVHVNQDAAITYLWINGELIVTTPEHPFYNNMQEWVDAQELLPGDLIHRADGSTGIVQRIETVLRGRTMYNLTVDVAHTFYVGEAQWLVHNTIKVPGKRKYKVKKGTVLTSKGAKVTRTPVVSTNFSARGVKHSSSRDFSTETRAQVDSIGNTYGCHSCGTRNPGTKTGHWVPDHQTPNSFAKAGQQQQLYPQCLSCSRLQGLAIGRYNKAKDKGSLGQANLKKLYNDITNVGKGW